jgi:hypothetical protein
MLMQSDFKKQILEQLRTLFKNNAVQILGPTYANNDSPRLYHYTSLQSAENIIQKNKLRFTNVLYLNDPNEAKLGLDICEEVIIPLIKEYASHKEQAYVTILYGLLLYLTIGFGLSNNGQQKAEDLKKQLKEYVNEETLDEISRILNGVEISLYVSCLSEKSDDLRQWLPYGDDAQGIAIEFRKVIDNY